MVHQSSIQITTAGRGIYNLAAEVATIVSESSITTGICHLFLQHTSASLIVTENADPHVHQDLEYFMQKLVPDGHPSYLHTEEGPDDMPSHIRSVLTSSFLVIPITARKLVLGTWQGIYLWEHRTEPHIRKMTVTILG